MGERLDMIPDDVLQEMTRRIVKAVTPECVVLFGSRARGDSRADSDVDLLVVQKTDLPRSKRGMPLYSALRDYLIPVDIVVYTPAEVEEYGNLPHSFVQTALREGMVLYEKQGTTCSGLAHKSCE
jgi:predicted nucleotidyltransferase